MSAFRCFSEGNGSVEKGRLLVENAEKGNTEKIILLLNYGASVNAEEFNRTLFYASKNYMTPLQCAAFRGYQKCVQILIEREADLDARDRFDVTAAHMAAENGHHECLKMLLDAGADCNIATKYSKRGCYTATPHLGGTTPLHLAAANNNVKCVRELIQNGADYNAVDELGRTSLFMAAQAGYAKCVLTHLQNAIGRDILSLPVNDTGDTPLHECVRLGMEECVSQLLRHGSDVNYRNQVGLSPLHLAVFHTEKFSMNILRDLILNGYNTDINLLDGGGMTPLHYLCFSENRNQERRPDAASFLIAYGANPHIQNKRGISLIQAEIKLANTDRTILQAIIKSVLHVPNLPSLNFNLGCIRSVFSHVPKLEWYHQIATMPRSLQHYCRYAIRQTMEHRRVRHVTELPLPTSLKEYLLLEFDEYK